MKHVTSRDNPAVKRLHALAHSGRERRKLGRTVLDGTHLVESAMAAGWPLLELIVSDEGLGRAEIRALLRRLEAVPTLHLADPLFAHVSPVDTPSGLLAVIDIPPARALRTPEDSLLVLDGVQDPGNLGTILRTAAAAGLADVLLTDGCAQAWSPRVLRAGMGGQFQLRIHEHADVARLLDGYRGEILATGVGAESRILFDIDLRGSVAWLFGAEGQGLSAEIAALATTTVTIPMPGPVESLNVGAAAAVCLFEQVRQCGAAKRG